MRLLTAFCAKICSPSPAKNLPALFYRKAVSLTRNANHGVSAIQRPYLKRERLFAGTFLLFVSLIVARLIRLGWMDLCGGVCVARPVLLFGTVAPEGYRIGLPILWYVLIRLLHLHNWSNLDAAIEVVCCFSTLLLLYNLTVKGLNDFKERIASLAMFLAFIQFPFAFILFRQRVDTLPTSLFIALALLSVSRLENRWTALLLFITFLQSFIRADVPFIFGIALVLINVRDLRSHFANLARGLGVMLIAGCVQVYLQFVKFPHLPYSTKVVTFHENLNSTHLIIFTLALAPFIGVFLLLRPSRIDLREIDRLAVLTSLLYLPIWFTVGVVTEVRIFVPFLLALCVVAPRISTGYLLPAPRAEEASDNIP